MIIRFLLLLVVPIIITAQNADEVIERLQQKFSTVQDLSAGFKQSIISAHSTNPISFDGKFIFKKEKSFSIILPERDIISDGVSIWNVDKKQNKVVISTVNDESSNFSLNEIINTYPEKCDLSLVESTTIAYRIKAIPSELDLNFKEAFLTINKDYILSKVEIIDFNNIKYSFELFSVKINQKLDAKLFQFISSDGVEIIDLR